MEQQGSMPAPAATSHLVDQVLGAIPDDDTSHSLVQVLALDQLSMSHRLGNLLYR